MRAKMGHNLGQDTGGCLVSPGTGDGTGGPRSSSTEASSHTGITHRVAGQVHHVPTVR